MDPTLIPRLAREAVARFKAWRRRRYWTPERQLENLRNLVMGDHRYLAHDQVADALTARYLAALAPDWYKTAHADSWHFRKAIGLEPDYGFRIADDETGGAA
jgi:hypothetical protein